MQQPSRSGTDRDRQAQARHRLELGGHHHQAAVAREADHASVGMDELRRDGRARRGLVRRRERRGSGRRGRRRSERDHERRAAGKAGAERPSPGEMSCPRPNRERQGNPKLPEGR